VSVLVITVLGAGGAGWGATLSQARAGPDRRPAPLR
jgi:hypothetical protein